MFVIVVAIKTLIASAMKTPVDLTPRTRVIAVGPAYQGPSGQDFRRQVRVRLSYLSPRKAGGMPAQFKALRQSASRICSEFRQLFGTEPGNQKLDPQPGFEAETWQKTWKGVKAR